MRTLFVFLGVVVVTVTANVAGRRNICNEEREDGFVEMCCEGYTGLEEGCVTPVCKPECDEYGGTCVSPNVCSNCPEGRFGDNCERSLCQQERENHRLLSRQERRQRNPPTCLPDGTYTILQCSEISRMCHCVDRWTGEPYVNTYTYGVPDCRKYYVNEKPLFSPKEVLPIQRASDEQEPAPIGISVTGTVNQKHSAPCRTALEEWKSSSWRYFLSKPDCTDDGFYKNKRCDFIFGYCVCIDPNTGVDIEGSKVFSTTLVCTDMTAPELTPEVEPEPVPADDSGCTVGDVRYEQDQSFYRDCNVCTCHGYSVIQCTTRTCNPDACYLGESDKVVEHRTNGECHRCLCEHGVFECSVIDCDQVSHPVEVPNVQLCEGNKPPNSQFYQECNYCGCSDGPVWCTEMECPGHYTGEEPSTYCYVNGVYLQDGQDYTNGCDTVRCAGGQLEMIESCAESMTDLILTEVRPEEACEYNDETFYNGESMLLGSSHCKCEFFDWNCQAMAM